MSDRIRISKDETGLIRLFSIDTAAEPPLMSAEPDWGIDADDPPWPLRDALGTVYLDSDFIEMFDIADLGEQGLAGYLVRGLRVSAEDVAADRARIDAVRGMVLVVMSSAFGGFAQELTPRSPLHWIATYREEGAPSPSDIPATQAGGGTRKDPQPMTQTTQSFRADRMTYWRDHAWMAALAVAIGMGVLWAMGNPYVWTGAIGGLAAVAVRAFYLASDEANAEWVLTDTDLIGPDNRRVPLAEIDRLRSLGSAVQIITRSGDKHLMKYLADRPRVVAEIEAAMARVGNAP